MSKRASVLIPSWVAALKGLSGMASLPFRFLKPSMLASAIPEMPF